MPEPVVQLGFPVELLLLLEVFAGARVTTGIGVISGNVGKGVGIVLS